MRYIFESGHYPHETVIDDKEFENDQLAIEHAKKIDADYVWDAPEWNSPDNRNPSTVYRKALTTATQVLQ